MNILSQRKVGVQFRCRIICGRISYERRIRFQDGSHYNLPVMRDEIDSEWSRFYGEERS